MVVKCEETVTCWSFHLPAPWIALVWLRLFMMLRGPGVSTDLVKQHTGQGTDGADGPVTDHSRLPVVTHSGSPPSLIQAQEPGCPIDQRKEDCPPPANHQTE